MVLLMVAFATVWLDMFWTAARRVWCVCALLWCFCVGSCFTLSPRAAETPGLCPAGKQSWGARRGVREPGGRLAGSMRAGPGKLTLTADPLSLRLVR
jgi:hypothetical protein